MFEQPQFVTLIQEFFEKKMAECFRFDQLIPLVYRLIPDWKQRLGAWTKEQIQRDRRRSGHYGGSFAHYAVKGLFRSLDKAKMLKDFMVSLHSDISFEAFADDLKRIRDSL